MKTHRKRHAFGHSGAPSTDSFIKRSVLFPFQPVKAQCRWDPEAETYPHSPTSPLGAVVPVPGPAPSSIPASRAHHHPGAVATPPPGERVPDSRQRRPGVPGAAGPAPRSPEPGARSPPGGLPPRPPRAALPAPSATPRASAPGTAFNSQAHPRPRSARGPASPPTPLSPHARTDGRTDDCSCPTGGPAPPAVARPQKGSLFVQAQPLPLWDAPRRAQPRLTVSETPRDTHPGGSSCRCCCCWDPGRRPRGRCRQHRHSLPSSSSCGRGRPLCSCSCQWLRLRDYSRFPSPPF